MRTQRLLLLAISLVLTSELGLTAEPADVEKFVKARIEIGDRMGRGGSTGRGY